MIKTGDKVRLSKACLDEVYQKDSEYVDAFILWAKRNKTTTFTITGQAIGGYRTNMIRDEKSDNPLVKYWCFELDEIVIVNDLPEELFTL